jgi:hypothetical protein
VLHKLKVKIATYFNLFNETCQVPRHYSLKRIETELYHCNVTDVYDRHFLDFPKGISQKNGESYM